MFRLFMRNSRVYHTPDLDFAIETGIKAREDKCMNDKRRKDNSVRRKEDQEDRNWLDGSARRLRSILAFVERMPCSDGD